MTEEHSVANCTSGGLRRQCDWRVIAGGRGGRNIVLVSDAGGYDFHQGAHSVVQRLFACIACRDSIRKIGKGDEKSATVLSYARGILERFHKYDLVAGDYRRFREPRQFGYYKFTIILLTDFISGGKV